ncbi:hypothetical protein D3C76_707030 [compost metagenome]
MLGRQLVIAATCGNLGQTDPRMQDEGVGTFACVVLTLAQADFAGIKIAVQIGQFAAQQVQSAKQQAVLAPALPDQLETLLQQRVCRGQLAIEDHQADAVGIDQHLAGQAALAPGEFEGGVQ